jgi:phosphoserine phosphatase
MYGQIQPDHVEEAFKNTAKLEGLTELVAWAKHHGINIAVLTTGPEFFARRFIQYFGFDHVVGSMFPVHEGTIELDACQVVRDADKPEHATSLCQRLNVRPLDCVVVGDSRSDVELFQIFTNSIALNYSVVLAGKARYYLRSLFAQDLIPALASMLSI